MEELEPTQGVRCDVLFAHWPSLPCGICSQAAGVKALRVRLELALFLFTCVFPSPHTSIFAPKEGGAEASGVHALIEV